MTSLNLTQERLLFPESALIDALMHRIVKQRLGISYWQIDAGMLIEAGKTPELHKQVEEVLEAIRWAYAPYNNVPGKMGKEDPLAEAVLEHLLCGSATE